MPVLEDWKESPAVKDSEDGPYRLEPLGEGRVASTSPQRVPHQSNRPVGVRHKERYRKMAPVLAHC